MAYNNQGNRQIQSAEESLHWISFNLKKLVEEVKHLSNLLNPQALNFPSSTQRNYNRQPSSAQQNQEQRSYQQPQQPEIPF